jgi:hypothetical protein
VADAAQTTPVAQNFFADLLSTIHFTITSITIPKALKYEISWYRNFGNIKLAPY